ncbi:hypothetical protein TNIN_339871 [Trichonephila inaurata madagascariensis]|uniref:Uncharacterized protein n=1 Tax=Trichonephila inaurata madagascariensis TaxID=2747483 RepID=A0A8X7BUY9_9ARAC|nr:hypothetical protein TNIN_339871 [Trichonephila inaurata madagascariensis]
MVCIADLQIRQKTQPPNSVGKDTGTRDCVGWGVIEKVSQILRKDGKGREEGLKETEKKTLLVNVGTAFMYTKVRCSWLFFFACATDTGEQKLFSLSLSSSSEAFKRI